MGNVISLKSDNKSILIDTNELFDMDALNSLKSIVINHSFKTDSFMLGIYKYISEGNNMCLICAYKGNILFDDSFKINPDINYDEFRDENYQKLKNLLILNRRV